MATAPFFRGARLTLIFQAEVAECGLACLAVVASYLGLRTDLATLRGRFRTSLNGASMLTLTEYRRTYWLAMKTATINRNCGSHHPRRVERAVFYCRPARRCERADCAALSCNIRLWRAALSVAMSRASPPPAPGLRTTGSSRRGSADCEAV